MRILVLGVSGMVGNGIFRFLQKQPGLSVFGTSRRMMYEADIFSGVYNEETFLTTINYYHPDVVINCVGVTPQMAPHADNYAMVWANAALPHYLERICTDKRIRLIHISTDCVFSGSFGDYAENAVPTPHDLYGKSKFIGEIEPSPHLTIRTSFIGHGLFEPKLGLVDWLLSQDGKEINGYDGCIFSGFPVVTFAQILFDHVITKPLTGIYHISSEPISKFDLLCMIRDKYRLDIRIWLVHFPQIDRSLNSDKFRAETGWSPKPWQEMIDEMYEDFKGAK